ncbi:tRNA synthetase [Gracilaria domingensis]|nr:tRNA synthetase [Gracilaria domingensis]
MRRLGASCDWDRARFTPEDHMSALVAEAFKRLHDQGLVYKGNYMVNWSPKLRTAVSDLEIEFSEENGKLYYFQYPLSDGSGFISVATTRPETILGDTTVCVHPEDERYRTYVRKTVKIYEFLWDEIADCYVEMSKTRFFGNDADAARHTRATLVYVMDTCLRFLYPFTPFVTEAIWHRFPRDGSNEQALIFAEWPSRRTVDREVIGRFEKMQSLVRYIRNARAEYQVDHGRRIPLIRTDYRTDAITASDVDSEKIMLFLSTKVDPARCTIEVVEEQSAEVTSASQNGTDDNALHPYAADKLEAIIPMRDMIDFDKERKRLEKQSQKLQKDLEGLKGSSACR